MTLCSIEGCTARHKGRGLCAKHLMRWRRHGDAGVVITPPSVADRFWSKVNQATESGCWEWTGSLDRHGYGWFSIAAKPIRAHRWSYEHHVGPIPAGLVLDHLCRNPSCVNPAHLEPVTSQENIRRGTVPHSSKTHCPHGHPYSGDNLIVDKRGHRSCRTCRRSQDAARRAQQRGAA